MRSVVQCHDRRPTHEMYSWSPEGGTPTISEIPESEMEKARELNQKLVEAAAENDETLMENSSSKVLSPKMKCGKASAKVSSHAAYTLYSV